MPKGKQNQDVELDFGSEDGRELTGSDANPIDAATGESLFDDLSPRFVRQLDAAAAKESGKPGKQAASEDDEDEIDELDRDEDARDEEEEEDEDADEPRQNEEAADEEDEDADEPRPGRKTAFEKRLARSDRLLEESRVQIQELQQREAQREARDKLAASEGEYNTFKQETETKLADLRKKKVAALENGETEVVADLDEQLIDLKSELRTREREHERAKKEVEEAAKRRPVSTITATKVAQWKRKHPRFEADPEFKAVVIAIDQELARGGSNTESDEHYKELDRRLKKLYPDHGGRPKPARRHPSQQVDREGSPSQRRQAAPARVAMKGGKLRISAEKLARVKANMKTFGLDPTNKKDLFDYISNNPGI